MREWSPAAKNGILGWLEAVCREKPAVQEVELWRVTKDTRELRCVVRYLPNGLDLRLMLGDEFRTNGVPQGRAKRAGSGGRVARRIA